MAVSNGCRLLLLLSPLVFLLLPISVVTFILERITQSTLRGQTFQNSRTGAFEIDIPRPGTSSIDTTITLDINQNTSFAVLGVCTLAAIVLALDAFGLWELRKVGGTARHERLWCWIVVIGNIVLAGIAAGMFGYASSVQSEENGFGSIADMGKDDRAFTKETWACKIRESYPGQEWSGSACGTAQATRLLLLPLAVSALLVNVSIFFVARSRGGIKWLVGGKGRYAGFASVYEMQPGGPHPPYNGQPMPQWTSHPHPQSQWGYQPAPYWQGHPSQAQQQWLSQSVQYTPAQVIPEHHKTGIVVQQQQGDSRQPPQ